MLDIDALQAASGKYKDPKEAKKADSVPALATDFCNKFHSFPPTGPPGKPVSL